VRRHVFACVDCNNFYVSCERVFDAKLARRAVVVLSNNDGCVISRSEEAKALGVGMGAPYFRVRALCEREGVAVFSSNYALYGDMSRRVMETLAEFAPEIDLYSIDEAFLNLSHFGDDSLTEPAREIRATVRRWTGVPVGIGIARMGAETLRFAASGFKREWEMLRGRCSPRYTTNWDELLLLRPIRG
jgi:DNA polymerase V